MRRNPTDTEHRLWQLVRAKRLSGWKVRRQQPVGAYIADSLCAAAKLIVEVDGGQHARDVDTMRGAWLRRQGFTTLRFWNNDIFNNEEGVLTSILSALEASAAASRRDGRTLSPALSRKGRGALVEHSDG
ncbi:endonuclease domain-containing protein [Sphingosinicella sp. BN140058]|uniref:endonuclease domain-containing protein n=1 Tax=Sphingosinicella sp. BN140058 TaxID=1892855 RepID=UPI001FB0E195|nr:DUF559 domain-containing protein [Sphingosinicella sp. BN140058]